LALEVRRPRVLIADDNAGMRTAVGRLLSPSCDVVAYAVDVATLFEATVEFRPDVVLLDLSLPGELNGFEACGRLLKLTPEVKVIAFTADDGEDVRRGAYEAGCSGFVWKLQAPPELLSAIHAVVNSGSRSPDG
jgi:DNA-binding NarL/FixJ family response regulator